MQKLEELYTDVLTQIGEDPKREGLAKTPARAARAIKFLTAGYEQSVEEVVNGALFSSDIDEMVVLKNIEIYSLCEHHLLPFVGQCHIAYLPQGKVLGISKIARLVEVFTRRLQIQENLTKQIADTLLEVTSASGVGVLIEAQHFCMMMRGIQKQNSVLSTSVMLGEFRNNPQTRNEFLSLLAKK
jgi:GTP cyclohydrolase I